MKIDNLIPTLKLRSPIRISLDRKLIPKLKILKGSILDIGSGADTPYKKYMNENYTTADIDPSTNPDIVCPIEDMSIISYNSFDNVVATEVLEHSSNPQKAIDEIYRVLVDGGTCVLTTRFMYELHRNPKDYFRFTEDGFYELFKKFKTIEIIPQGNRLFLLWQIINPNIFTRSVLNVFNWFIGLFDFEDRKFANGYLIVAIK